ncbi:MAG: hypothetical protein BGO69_09105 [Bacteroidetes bacterium 46-16]|nr:MAG: hypothetical protein BGO69_09105 [Bacteroidetes bacterium 46-16]
MFVFYHLQDFILLEKLQLLKLIAEKSFIISISQLVLSDYSTHINRQIEGIAQKGLVEIREQDDSVYDFVESNNEKYPASGRSLLALLHFCKSGNYTLVVDTEDVIVAQFASLFSVPICTLLDFYRSTINDEKYIEFIMELKRESVIK